MQIELLKTTIRCILDNCEPNPLVVGSSGVHLQHQNRIYIFLKCGLCTVDFRLLLPFGDER